MTLYLDADYNRRSRIRPSDPMLSELIAVQASRESVPFAVKELNPDGFGDVMFTGLDGIYSGEIKGAAEIMGSLDSTWGQLRSQMENANRMFLAIYGRVEEAEDGNCYVLTALDEHSVYDHGVDSRISRSYNRRHFRQNYRGYRRWLSRMDQIGISVFEVPSLKALAVELMGLYLVATTESDSVNRLVVEKFTIKETDKPRRDFMLTLMGIQSAGIGEELAEGITVWAEKNIPGFPDKRSIASLLYALVEYDYDSADGALAKQPLRSGKRTVGPAAVKKLRIALGVE